jgi:predicted PurR-regulated permease PerM
MNFMGTAYAAGIGASAFVHRIESAPTIVVVIMALIGVTVAVLMIMWLFLPFAVYGLKKRLDEQTMLLESMREHLEQVQRAQRTQELAKLALPEDEPRLRL